MPSFEAFWVKIVCRRFGPGTDAVVTSLRKGKYHVECVRCGRRMWLDQAVVDRLEKRIVPVAKGA